MVNGPDSESTDTSIGVKITVRKTRKFLFRRSGNRLDELWDGNDEDKPFAHRFGNAVEDALKHNIGQLGFSSMKTFFFLDSRKTGLNGVLLLNAADASLIKSRQYLEYIRLYTIAEVHQVWEGSDGKRAKVAVEAEIDDPPESIDFQPWPPRHNSHGDDSDADNPHGLLARVSTNPIVLGAAVTAIFAAIVAISTSEVTKALGEGQIQVDAVSALMANTESIKLTELGVLKLDALITLVEENEDLKVNVSGFKKMVQQFRKTQLKELDDQNKELEAKVALGEYDAQRQLNENNRKIDEIMAQTKAEADSKEALTKELAGMKKIHEQELAKWSNERKALTSDLVKERETVTVTKTDLQEARDEIEKLKRNHASFGSFNIANKLKGTSWEARCCGELEGSFFTFDADGELVVSSVSPNERNPKRLFNALTGTGSWVVDSDIVTLSYSGKNIRLVLDEDWPSELHGVNQNDKLQRLVE